MALTPDETYHAALTSHRTCGAVPTDRTLGAAERAEEGRAAGWLEEDTEGRTSRPSSPGPQTRSRRGSVQWGGGRCHHTPGTGWSSRGDPKALQPCGERAAQRTKCIELLISIRPPPGCVGRALTPPPLRPQSGPTWPWVAHKGQAHMALRRL